MCICPYFEASNNHKAVGSDHDSLYVKWLGEGSLQDSSIKIVNWWYQLSYWRWGPKYVSYNKWLTKRNGVVKAVLETRSENMVILPINPLFPTYLSWMRFKRLSMQTAQQTLHTENQAPQQDGIPSWCLMHMKQAIHACDCRACFSIMRWLVRSVFSPRTSMTPLWKTSRLHSRLGWILC